MPLEAKKKISVDVALIDESVHFSPMGPNKKQELNKVSRKLKKK